MEKLNDFNFIVEKVSEIVDWINENEYAYENISKVIRGEKPIKIKLEVVTNPVKPIEKKCENCKYNKGLEQGLINCKLLTAPATTCVANDYKYFESK